MKPLHLEIRAFGPYADVQAIDFAQLRDYRFFLIHGPTGSGKTSLMDAMCYALYGDTSGKVRSGENMRSDYAADTEATEVTFDFAVGAECYRVRRSPRQWLARKRGAGGLVEVGESACIWRIDESRRELAVLAEKSQRVTAEVQRVLGFRSDQFRQVVLLPQGDFRRLLLADSSERQDIMQTLFRTEFYGVVEQRLKEAVKTWADRYAELTAKLQELQTIAGVATLGELQERTAADEQALTGLQQQLGEAAAAVAKARQVLEAAQLARRILEERDQAQTALQLLQADAAAIDAKRAELQQALRAAEADGAVAVAQERLQDRETATTRWQSTVKEWKEAVVRSETAAREWEAVQGREVELTGMLQEKNRLEEMANRSKALSQAVMESRSCRSRAAVAAEALKTATAAVTVLQEKLDKLQGREAELLALVAEVGGREATLNQWKAVAENRHKFEQWQGELGAKEAGLQAATGRAAAARTRWEEERERLARLQECWEQEQAALLAAGLADGKPCPVCGSLQHPTPAAAGGELPDPAELRRQKLQTEELAKLADQARQQEYEAKSARDSLQERLQLLGAELGEFQQWSSSRIEQAVRESRQACQDAVQAREESARLKRQREQWQQELGLAKAGREQRELVRTAAESKAQAAEAVVAERQAAVPEEYRDADLLARAVADADSRIAVLRGLIEKGRRQASEAAEALARATAQQDERRQARERAEKAWEQAETEKQRRIGQAGFASEEEYRRARRPGDMRRLLDASIREFDSRLAAAGERLERAKLAAGGIGDAPELVAREADYAAAKEREQELHVAAGRLQDRLGQQRELAVRFAELQGSRDEAEAQHSLYAGLLEIAAGRFTGVSFERYVLGFLLDEVNLYANLRLKGMTRGRYRLRRREDREDRRRGAGLDLEVLDAYTGEARPVQTLSGGETFLASLSLALGLADVVQARAGGIYLETLFVDEGFGTLDAETLDLAVKALLDLQQGGRLVGIISHVPELRERINARLEIIPVGRGSRAEFHIG